MNKRILDLNPSDFRKMNSQELKKSILNAEGRTILVDLAAEAPALYPSVSNLEIVSAFGADLILLKDIDVIEMNIPEVGKINKISDLRYLTGIPIGVNLIIKDSGPENKRLTDKSLYALLNKEPDFISLTAYLAPEATKERIISDIQMVRNHYDGFLMLNPVVSHCNDLDLEVLKSYVSAGVDMINLPAPGSVPGSTESVINKISSILRESGVLIDCVIGTSQEGSDGNLISEIALSSKRAGIDLLELGDSGVSGVPEPQNIYKASLTIRGKKHTYTRMARSVNR
jgi:hypothetical protein